MKNYHRKRICTSTIGSVKCWPPRAIIIITASTTNTGHYCRCSSGGQALNRPFIYSLILVKIQSSVAKKDSIERIGTLANAIGICLFPPSVQSKPFDSLGIRNIGLGWWQVGRYQFLLGKLISCPVVFCNPVFIIPILTITSIVVEYFFDSANIGFWGIRSGDNTTKNSGCGHHTKIKKSIVSGPIVSEPNIHRANISIFLSQISK